MTDRDLGLNSAWRDANAESRARVIHTIQNSGCLTNYNRFFASAYPTTTEEFEVISGYPKFVITADKTRINPPDSLKHESPLKTPEEMAKALACLDEVADMVTGLFINGGVFTDYLMYETGQIILPDESSGSGIEGLLDRLTVPPLERRRNLFRIMRDTEPALQEYGYKIASDSTDEEDRYSRNAFVVMPDSARLLTRDSKKSFNVPSWMFLPGPMNRPGVENRFWESLSRATGTFIKESDLGKNNWPVRVLGSKESMEVLSEIYVYQIGAEELLQHVIDDIIGAVKLGMYPKKRRFSIPEFHIGRLHIGGLSSQNL